MTEATTVDFDFEKINLLISCPPLLSCARSDDKMHCPVLARSLTHLSIDCSYMNLGNVHACRTSG